MLKLQIYILINENQTAVLSNEFAVKLGNLLPAEYENEKGEPQFIDFYENHLLKNKQDAEKIVIYTVAHVVRANLQVIMFDYEENKVETIEFKSKYSEGRTISLIFRITHYDLVYSTDQFSEFAKVLSQFISLDKEKVVKQEESLVSDVFDLMNITEINDTFAAAEIKDKDCFICYKQKRTGEMAFCYLCVYKSFVGMVYNLYVNVLRANYSNGVMTGEVRLSEELSFLIISLRTEHKNSRRLLLS